MAQRSAVVSKPVSRTRGTVIPSLPELQTWLDGLDERPKMVPIFREVMADTDTPVSAFLKLRSDGPAFLLESVEGGERIARYSFIGANPIQLLTLRDGVATIQTSDGMTETQYTDPLAVIAEALEPFTSQTLLGLPLPRFLGGGVGYLSYESVRSFEPRVGEAPGTGRDMPIATFMIVDGLLVFDNLERTVKAVSHVKIDPLVPLEDAYQQAVNSIDRLLGRLREPLGDLPRGSEPVIDRVEDRIRSNTDRERYHEIIKRAKDYITAGDIFQVVLSQRVDVPTPVHPFTIYRALRAINPSPYMFYLDFVDHQIVGASPELLVRLEDGVVTNHPIAGTRPRGQSSAEDAALAEELMNDEKERAEHVMLVDLGRNDVGQVAKPGTVRVPRFMGIDRYSHVMHLVTHVEGDLRDGLTAFDALRACFPAGTVSGAPKVRAMEIISELETDRRGPYAGAVGYFDFSGEMDTCIALRTMVFKDGIASLQAGGGVVADSTADGEYAESFHKMGALIRAIEMAERIEAGEPPHAS
jgi:anthranilate synthase component I